MSNEDRTIPLHEVLPWLVSPAGPSKGTAGATSSEVVQPNPLESPPQALVPGGRAGTLDGKILRAALLRAGLTSEQVAQLGTLGGISRGTLQALRETPGRGPDPRARVFAWVFPMLRSGPEGDVR